VLTFEFWRPQREAIPGAEAGRPSLPNCHRDQVSTTDPALTPELVRSPFTQGYGFRDSAADRPADPVSTLSFSVNVTECLASNPAAVDNDQTWDSGENISIGLQASAVNNAGNGVATQQLLFTRK